MKKLAWYAFLVFIGFYIFSNPTGAAHTAKNLANGLTHAGNAFGAFFTTFTG